MSNNNCNCCGKYSCLDIAVLASIILGVIAGVLRFTAVITVSSAFLWVAFGIAIVYLAVILISTMRRCAVCRCGRNALNAIFIGILGTILTSLILLAIDFVATSVIGAIIFGLLILFFALLIIASVCLIKKISAFDD